MKRNVVYDMEDVPPEVGSKISFIGDLAIYKIVKIKSIGIGNTWDEYELTLKKEVNRETKD